MLAGFKSWATLLQAATYSELTRICTTNSGVVMLSYTNNLLAFST